MYEAASPLGFWDLLGAAGSPRPALASLQHPEPRPDPLPVAKGCGEVSLCM